MPARLTTLRSSSSKRSNNETRELFPVSRVANFLKRFVILVCGQRAVGVISARC